MQKIFSRKSIKIFVPLLIVFFLAGTGMLIARAYYSDKAQTLIAADAGEGESSEVTDRIIGYLSDLLANYAKEEGADVEEEKPVYSAATLACISKVKTCTGFSIALYALCLIFVGFAITSAAYSSYLESDKYKAKLRRLEMAEKRRVTMK